MISVTISVYLTALDSEQFLKIANKKKHLKKYVLKIRYKDIYKMSAQTIAKIHSLTKF